MQQLLRRVARFAKSEAPVSICGETGTGKEVVARLLHGNSLRAGKPFVAINVAALSPELLESELFGHGKGAFTGATTQRQGLFEAAHGGTLFLDEIGEMPPALQAKLLRVLQDGEVRRVGENAAFTVDVRIICATHRRLADEVAAGRFREDLFFRLKVLSLSVPPLRERLADIRVLAQRFVTQERPGTTLDSDVIAALEAYGWPGNVRELQNVIKFSLALAADATIHLADLPDEVIAAPVHPSPAAPAPTTMSLAEAERRHILNVLAACNGSQAEAAAVLQIGRNTLWRKLKLYEATTQAPGAA